MDVSNKIREARKAAGLTQKGLAEKAGLATITIQQYESNKRQPRLNQLQKISHALGCPLSAFLQDDNIDMQDEAALHVMQVFGTDDKHIQKASQVASYYTEEKYKNLGYAFSDIETKLVTIFANLNDKGQRVAVERVKELTKIPDYQKSKEE